MIERHKRKEKVADLEKQYDKLSDKELSKMVKEFENYQIAAVEAALNAQFCRQIISLEEKDNKLSSIENYLFDKNAISQVEQKK